MSKARRPGRPSLDGEKPSKRIQIQLTENQLRQIARIVGPNGRAAYIRDAVIMRLVKDMAG